MYYLILINFIVFLMYPKVSILRHSVETAPVIIKANQANGKGDAFTTGVSKKSLMNINKQVF